MKEKAKRTDEKGSLIGLVTKADLINSMVF